MNSGQLIVLTGIDGSGKTTQAELLLEKLSSDGIEVSYVWSRWKPFLLRPLINRWKRNLINNEAEPKSNNAYEEVKDKKHKLLKKPIFKWLWLTAFFIDYGLQMFIKIRIKLFSNKLIVSDRIFYDSIIDQAINLGEEKDSLLNSLNSFWIKILFPQPNLVMFIDCPGDIAFYRKYDAPNIEYLEDRRRLYLKLADEYGWIKLDGTLPVSELADRIKQIVYERLKG